MTYIPQQHVNILTALWTAGSDPRAAWELGTNDIGMVELVDAGLVKVSRTSTRAWYTLVEEAAMDVLLDNGYELCGYTNEWEYVGSDDDDDWGYERVYTTACLR